MQNQAKQKNETVNRDQASDTGIEDIRARLGAIGEWLQRLAEAHSDSHPLVKENYGAAANACIEGVAALDAKDVQVRTRQAQIETLTGDLKQSRAETEAADSLSEKKIAETDAMWKLMLEQKARAEHAEATLSACQREAESDREALVDERNHWIREQRKAEAALLQMREALECVIDSVSYGDYGAFAVNYGRLESAAKEISTLIGRRIPHDS